MRLVGLALGAAVLCVLAEPAHAAPARPRPARRAPRPARPPVKSPPADAAAPDAAPSPAPNAAGDGRGKPAPDVPPARPAPDATARPEATAGGPVDPKVAQADRLFAEGKALIESNLLQACAKFEESLRVNPAAIGTLMNVALCDEKLGRVASAATRFGEARDRAREHGLIEHQRVAEQHASALAPAVPHLAISLTEALPGTQVAIDDTLIARDQLTDVAIDPGERVIVVTAPARLPHRQTVMITRGEHRALVVPALARSVTVTSSRRKIGQIVTFTGAATLGAGVALGVYARHVYRQQFGDGRPCRDGLCSPEGQTETERARTLGNIGTAIGAVGAVAAGLGVYLWLRSPASTPTDDGRAISVVPQLGPDGLGVAATGRF